MKIKFEKSEEVPRHSILKENIHPYIDLKNVRHDFCDYAYHHIDVPVWGFVTGLVSNYIHSVIEEKYNL